MSNQESPGGVSRRALLKSTALGSLALAAGGQPPPLTPRRAAAAGLWWLRAGAGERRH